MLYISIGSEYCSVLLILQTLLVTDVVLQALEVVDFVMLATE